MYGRVELERYKSGLATGLNYIPTLQGPLARRPGDKIFGTVKDSTKPPVFIPFEFSLTQAYILEVGDRYIRFWADDAQILAFPPVFQVSGFSYFKSLGPGFGAASPGFPFYATRADTSPQAFGYFTENIVNEGFLSSGPLELQSPYSYASDLTLLKTAQTADTLYLFHPSYPVFKLQREGQRFWNLRQVYLQDGPYLPLNTYRTLADNVNVGLQVLSPTNSSGVTFMQSKPVNPVFFAVSGSSGVVRLTTLFPHIYVPGSKVVVTGVAGTVEANNTVSNPYSTVSAVPGPNQIEIQGSVFTNAYATSAVGIVTPAIFLQQYGTNGSSLLTTDSLRQVALLSGAGRIFGFFSTGLFADRFNFIMDPYNASLQGLNAGSSFVLPLGQSFNEWQFGCFSPSIPGIGSSAYPSCGAFHQGRLFLAGSPPNPQQVDGSTVNSFENFAGSVPTGTTALSVIDTNAVQYPLVSKQVSTIQWLASSSQGLLAGAAASEWNLSPSSNADTLTPTSINAKQTSFFGSANLDAVQAGNATLYVQRAGRKIREMNFFFQVGTFQSTDLSQVSEHLTIPAVIKLAVTKETQPLVWALRSDGQLLSMMYNRQNSTITDVSVDAGWTRHQLGGQSDAAGSPPKVLSIAAIPSPDNTFDQLWMVVQRWVNSSNVVNVEALTKIYDDSFRQDESVHFDCCQQFYQSAAITAITIGGSGIAVLAIAQTSALLAVGSQIKIQGVVGLNQTTFDAAGNPIITNLLNEKTFIIGTSAVSGSNFNLSNYDGTAVLVNGYSAYVGGGQIAPLVSQISGITTLRGETVSVLADGGIHPPTVISTSGILTLAYPAAKIQFGYPYNSDGQLLRIEGGSATGTSLGQTRRAHKVAMMMHDVGDIQTGMTFTDLMPINLVRADQQNADQAPPLFSGIIRDAIGGDYDFETQLCFRQNSGLPGVIQAISIFMEEQDI